MAQKRSSMSAHLLTGRPGIGKTTVIRDTIALLGG
jgi:nucleoside-triphosphatase THEP1